MARWRLMQPHYLNVPGNQWQHKEIDRTTGRPRVINFDVPTLLHPDDPGSWTKKYDKDSGDVFVSDGHNPDPTDIIFKGPPTPDMEPVDDEAKQISASLAPKWAHPIEDLPATGGNYGDMLVTKFQTEMASLMSGMTANQSAPGATTEQFNELQSSIKGMLEQNASLLNILADSKGVRRL